MSIDNIMIDIDCGKYNSLLGCPDMCEEFAAELYDLINGPDGRAKLERIIRDACACKLPAPPAPPPAEPPPVVTGGDKPPPTPVKYEPPPATTPESCPIGLPPAGTFGSLTSQPGSTRACEYNFIGEPNFNNRLTYVIKTAVAAGVPAAKAISIAALSVPESNVIWLVDRGPGDLLFSRACWGCSAFVGLEFGEEIWARNADDQPIMNADGSHKIAAWAIRPSAVNDPDSRAYLLSRGLIADASYAAKHMKQPGPYFKLAGGLLDPVGSPEIRRYLEWIISNRKAKLLDNLSLGPTMQYLALSGEFVRATGAGSKGNCGFPDTWEDIWDFYMQSDVARIMHDHITYLDPGCTGMQTYPAEHPDDDVANVKWLTYHTGNKARAETYYVPADGNRDRGYHGALWRAINAAKAIGIKA